MTLVASQNAIQENDQRSAAGPSLSVIVPVFNGRLQLPRCLDALAHSSYETFEVIVVDDCSTDNSRQIVERAGARYLRTPRQAGPAAARNLGARHAAGDVLVFVDADVVVAPETLAMLAEDLARDAQLAAVFGSYDDTPAWSDFLSQYKNLMHHYVHQTAAERAATFWAGCGAMRRDVFLEFGGFRPDKYPKPSIEDIELGFRLAQAGHPILLDKRVQVKHLKKWTVRGLLRADISYRAIPWTELILESRNLPRDLNLDWSARASAVLVGLLVLAVCLLPVSLAGWFPFLSLAKIAAIAGGAVPLLLALNARVYLWFARKRGLLFTAGAVLAHWVYFFYSSAVFVIIALRHAVRRAPRSA